MKRTVSILLAALLLLFALPTFADGSVLEAGLYTSGNGSEVLYLDKEGVGVLTFTVEDTFYSYGVRWTGTSLEIERTKIPCSMVNGLLFFTYGDAVRTLSYAGAGEAYALGDAGTAFAGTYAAEDGRKLTLAADGKGVYADAAGEQTVYWGSLAPYWNNTVENTCFVLFDSFLCALVFADGTATLSTEAQGDILFWPVEAEEAPKALGTSLQAGVYVSDDSELMVLFDGGAGVLWCNMNGNMYLNGVSWTADALTVERIETPVAYAGDTLCFTYGGAVRFLKYAGVSDRYGLGDRNGSAYAGTYGADGKTLTLTADGQGVYADENGETPVFWGTCESFQENWTDCYILFDSYQALLTFAEDRVETQIDSGEQLTLYRTDAAQPAAQPVVNADDQVYYGYRLIFGGETIDVIPYLTAMGMDPKATCLILRPDGTGVLWYMEGEEELTWDDENLTAVSDGSSQPYTREGDHILLTNDDMTIEFAPAAEFEQMLTGATPSEVKEEPSAAVDQSLTGSWTFTVARAMGMEIPASMMDTTMSLILNADGSAVLVADDSRMELQWSEQDGKVVLSAAGEEVLTLIYDGTTLTLDSGVEGVEMVFERDA